MMKILVVVLEDIKHLSCVFVCKAKGQDIVQRSVLGSLLPEAMVCYLENYEAEHFSEIFLGEFDTPEAIWSSEMRYSIIHYMLIVSNLSSTVIFVLVYGYVVMCVLMQAYDDRKDCCPPG